MGRLFGSLNVLFAVWLASCSAAQPRPNILYVVVDDLRTELGGVFGVAGMVTPGFDKLMAESVTFTRAHANVVVCSPSRTSFLTGMRAKDTRVWTIGPYFRQQALNASSIVTMSQALKMAGYNATGAGKIWHPGTSSGGALSPDVGGDDAPMSWSYPDASPFSGYWECDEFYNGTVQSTASVRWPGGTGCVQSAECLSCLASNGVNSSFNSAWALTPCDDSCFPDGLVADRGLAELQWKAAHPDSGPWSLFLGFKRPHLNFFAPEWAYNLYNNATTPIAPNPLPATGMPQSAFYQNGEIGSAHDVRPYLYDYTDPDGQRFTLVEQWKGHELKRAYRASVTYMDSQLKRVLDYLDSSGLRNNTWVVAHGDHAWSLGEGGEWAKQNCREEATRVPLFIAPPTGPAGFGYARNATFSGVVELVDLFPTVLDLLNVSAGIVPPGQLAGDSLVPALVPESAAVAARDAGFSTAFSEISRGLNANATSSPPDGSIHGLSVRTHDWRFTAWVPYNYSTATPLWDLWNSTWDVELYDHRTDPAGGAFDYGAMENANLARDPQYADIVSQLTALLKASLA